MIGKTHTIKQAVKGPEIKDVKLFIKDKNRPNLLKKNEKRITVNKKKTTTLIGLQVPGLGQAHKVCGGVKPVGERSTLPLTWDSGGTVQQ